jgi:hypothetical protein
MKPMSDKVFVDSNLWLYAFVCRPAEEAPSDHGLLVFPIGKPFVPRYHIADMVRVIW